MGRRPRSNSCASIKDIAFDALDKANRSGKPVFTATVLLIACAVMGVLGASTRTIIAVGVIGVVLVIIFLCVDGITAVYGERKAERSFDEAEEAGKLIKERYRQRNQRVASAKRPRQRRAR